MPRPQRIAGLWLLRFAPCVVAWPAVAVAAPPVVAVFPLQSSRLQLDDDVRSALTDLLIARLTATGNYQALPRAQLQRRLRQQKLASYKACYDKACQIEIGRELAAQKSLATQVVRLGGRCVVVATLYDLARATAEHSAESRGACDEDALDEAITHVVTALARGSTPLEPTPLAPARAAPLTAAVEPPPRHAPLRERWRAPPPPSAPPRWGRPRGWVLELSVPMSAQVFVAGLRGGAGELSATLAYRVGPVEPELHAFVGVGVHRPDDGSDAKDTALGGGLFAGVGLPLHLGARPFRWGHDLRAVSLRLGAGVGWTGWALFRDEQGRENGSLHHVAFRGAAALRYYIKPHAAVVVFLDYQYSLARFQAVGAGFGMSWAFDISPAD